MTGKKTAFDTSVLEGLSDVLDLGLEKGTAAQTAEGQAKDIPLDLIDPDPEQPRKIFNQARLDELAASIKADRVYQPITVFPNPDDPSRYLIIYGERRWRASKLAGKETIPAMVDEKHNVMGQFVENIQREDLSVFETAAGISRFLAQGMKQTEIAAQVGKGKSWVSEFAALGSAPGFIKHLADEGICSDRRSLFSLLTAWKNHPANVEAYCQRQRQSLTRQTVNEFIASLAAGDTSSMKAPSTIGTAAHNNSNKAATADSRALSGQVLRFKQQDGSVVVAKLVKCEKLEDGSEILDISSVDFTSFISYGRDG